MTTPGPFFVSGENCANGANIAIEVEKGGIKQFVVIARTVAVRAPWALHGREPIEHDEAVANAHRIVAALNDPAA